MVGLVRSTTMRPWWPGSHGSVERRLMDKDRAATIERGRGPAFGIVVGLILSIPFWLAIGFILF
ncbi:hypothetical protein FHS87_001976 [Roseomonas pecuniae]|uniref:Uncharacterized protein n=1 Tax=Muricoccus pecuniae TaxID=693023 RepID=A0A840Y577_9PROT|nr:hypothetical protein [Roseomonas pecuniae]